MENSYGIGIANRYELFLVDEEAGTPTNKAIKKAKQQKKSTASANVAANGAATVEKENKPANSNKASNPASSKPQQQQQQPQQQQQQSATGKSAKPNQNGQQNSRSDRPPRDGKDNKNQDRKTDGNVQNGENREQRYNRNNNPRKPRENQQLNNADGTTGAVPNRSGGRNFNNERNFNTDRNFINDRSERNERSDRNDRGLQNRRPYGKREFDRQSGSDKTGVKAIDKRDGAGAHNWGTHKQDIDDYNKGNVAAADWDAERDGPKVVKDDKANNGETKPTDEQNGKDGNVTEPAASIEEETKEITLDEWKAQRAERAKPQYNIRKAGEGEDTSQWKKMVALDNRKKRSDESEEEYEYDPSMYPQRVGRQKFLDIDIHFNDGPRGNINRRRGRQRPGPRQWNGSNAEGQEIAQNITTTQTTGSIPPTTVNNNANANANATANIAPAIVNANPINTTTNANNAVTNNTNNNRRRNNQSYRNRQDRGRFDERRQNAPKVDDENDFPSLG